MAWVGVCVCANVGVFVFDWVRVYVCDWVDVYDVTGSVCTCVSLRVQVPRSAVGSKKQVTGLVIVRVLPRSIFCP